MRSACRCSTIAKKAMMSTNADYWKMLAVQKPINDKVVRETQKSLERNWCVWRLRYGARIGG